VIKLLLFINLFSTSYPAPPAGPDTVIACQFSNLPFPGFCEYIYRESGVKIYYHDSWVSGLSVTMNAEQISVKYAVESALEGTGLEVSTWNNDLVVLPGEKLLSGLPLFELEQIWVDTSVTGENSITLSEERYLTGRKADVTQTMQIGRKGLTGTTSMVTIRGRITEQQTGEPVIVPFSCRLIPIPPTFGSLTTKEKVPASS